MKNLLLIAAMALTLNSCAKNINSKNTNKNIIAQNPKTEISEVNSNKQYFAWLIGNSDYKYYEKLNKQPIELVKKFDNHI